MMLGDCITMKSVQNPAWCNINEYWSTSVVCKEWVEHLGDPMRYDMQFYEETCHKCSYVQGFVEKKDK